MIVEQILEVLNKHTLTFEQYAYMYFIKERKSQLFIDSTNLYQKADTKAFIDKISVTTLVTKGLLKFDGKYILTDKGRELFIDYVNYAERIIDVYPAFVEMNGTIYSLSIISIEKLEKELQKHITTEDDFQTILEDIKYGKEKELIKIKIVNFFESKNYLQIRKLRQQSEEAETDIDSSIVDNDIMDI